MKSLKRWILAPLLIFATLCAIGCNGSKTLIYEKNKQIWIAYTNGKDAKMLASPGERPAWIPGTKTHFAYVERKPYTNNMKLWKVDADGKNPKALTGFDLHFDYSWSPDGKWIAVSRFANNNYDIFKVPASGGAPIQLTKHTSHDQYPAWSPDRNKLAFISARPGVTDYGVFVIDADGKNEKRLTPVSLQIHGFEDGRLSWSWDGKHIAFVGRWGGREEIATVDMNGKITQLTTPTVHPGASGCFDPHWYDRYLFYFCSEGIVRRDMKTGNRLKLGKYYPKFQHSRPSANASRVFFSYAMAPPSHIVSIQHYTKDETDLGEGEHPGVWGATLPLLP